MHFLVVQGNHTIIDVFFVIKDKTHFLKEKKIFLYLHSISYKRIIKR